MSQSEIGSPAAELGQAVRALRREREMSQEELAARADVHITWIGRIETGRINPKLSTVVSVARALGIRASDLIALAEGPIDSRKSSRGLEAEIGWRRRESADGFD